MKIFQLCLISFHDWTNQKVEPNCKYQNKLTFFSRDSDLTTSIVSPLVSQSVCDQNLKSSLNHSKMNIMIPRK